MPLPIRFDFLLAGCANPNLAFSQKFKPTHQFHNTAVNPDAVITRHAIRIDATNIETLFSTCEVIIEAFDDAASKALLFSKYMNSEKLLVGVSGIAGIGQSERITVRKIRKNCFIVGDESSAVSDLKKPYAPRVMVAAAKMADLILSRVLAGTSLSG